MCPCRSTSCGAHEMPSSSAPARGVRRSRACWPRAGTTSRLRLAIRSRRERSRRPGATRATCRTSTSRGSRPRRSTTRRSPSADLHVVAVPSNAFAEVVRALPGAAPVLSLTKGLDPESGGRLSQLVERRARRRALGPELRRGDRRGPAGGGGDRERGREARRGAAGGGQLDGLPRLRERRPGRGRALRGREERDRARGRRGRRAQPRRQRQGGADRARAGRDGPPRRSLRRRAPRPSRGLPGWAT